MWIKVRSMDGKKSFTLTDLSKLTKIEELRHKLVDLFSAPAATQRLFYRGKQLEDGHTLFDYNMALNDTIQIFIRDESFKNIVDNGQEKSDGSSSGYGSPGSSNGESNLVDENDNISESNTKKESEDKSVAEMEDVLFSMFYEVGDIIDCQDMDIGTWSEAKIIKITQPKYVAGRDLNSDLDEIDSDQQHPLSNSCKTSETHDRLTEAKETGSDPEYPLVNGKLEVESQLPSCNGGTLKTTGQTSNGRSSTKQNGNEIEDDSIVIEDDGFMYHILFDGFEVMEPLVVNFSRIRPRARTVIKFEELKVADRVMANFNVEDPCLRGWWYDMLITKITNTRTTKELYGTVFTANDKPPLYNCKLIFVNEVYQIELPVNVDLRKAQEDYRRQKEAPPKREVKPMCDTCHDNPHRKCRSCSCSVCGSKGDPSKQILCDECDSAYHIWCLTPPLEEIPSIEEWYCPICKNDETEVVRAGEKLKDSKRKSKMPSASSTSKRDWGKGMACVGRIKECTIVPPNHQGSIPGVEVGTQWKFRVQASEAGIHRPHVAGIHGRETEGSYSIVLAGGYEDDVDHGDEFYYTGSGGRDLSGNKRTAEQSRDQTLTRMNKALALNCAAPLNNKDGAVAKNWQDGKPVRVVRSWKGHKHSKFCPEEGIRYDGLYKIVKYWSETGKSGHLVWRFLLRRDDPSAAPWTKAGKLRMKQLGLTLQYPEGYLEAKEGKDDKSGKENTSLRCKPQNGKRTNTEPSSNSPPSKKARNLSIDLENWIEEDHVNQKLWKECKEAFSSGMQEFVAKVEEAFMCICCQEVVVKPITTTCKHNICKPCLQRSIKASVYTCPSCRSDLGKEQSLSINSTLQRILQTLLPGYENGR